MRSRLSSQNLGGDIVRGTKKCMRAMIVAIDYELTEVEVSKDQLSFLVYDYVILYYKKYTGFKSR